MAGETILVADDEPVRLKLTQAYLSNLGYKVIAASSAAEAGQLLGTLTPSLVYANLASSDGACRELVRNLRHKGQTAKILTAAHPGEEPKALEAGSDGSVARPVEMTALGAHVRDMLDGRYVSAAQAPASNKAAPGAESIAAAAARQDSAVELDSLRVRFLTEGSDKLRELVRQLDERFDIRAASKAVHQWIGTGGLLGFATISRLARDAENILAEQPLDGTQLRETFAHLSAAFAVPRGPSEEPLPPSIVEALVGKRIAAVEFTVQLQERLYAALERVRAQAFFLSAADSPDSPDALAADVVLIHVNSTTAASPWLDPHNPFGGRRPVVLTGLRDDLVALPQAAQALAREFLMDSWQPEEALVRLSLAVAHRPQGKHKNGLLLGMRTQVVIADDDPAVLSLVRTALENFGMDCHAANNGSDAIAAIRKLRPHAAVLDVNMPGMDGYEVLTAVRHDDLPVRVLLLTARQQESDVIRGFTLGADDYVVKPFSPMELVARLKRLLSR